ncbi:MAG TPA: hypothetical protein VF916_08165, partial [Ktedonobacterales bacterium]
RTYFVPIPQAPSWEALNRWLRQQCLEDQQRTMAGRDRPIAALLAEEQTHLGPLPAYPPEIGEVREVLVRSTGRVHFQTNEYSTPVRYAGSRLTLKADPFHVRLYAGGALGGELVAEHPRLYGLRPVPGGRRLPPLRAAAAGETLRRALRLGAAPRVGHR